MRVLVIGETGQVAYSIGELMANHCDAWSRSIRPAGIDVIFINRNSLDLAAPEGELQHALADLPACDIILNTAAYTAVDKAEDEPQLAHTINAIAPRLIAKECRKRGIPFIHISTDYVFDGQTQSPYDPYAKTNPLNVYGVSKAEGERKVHSYADSIIIRTSSVFSPFHNNFVSAMENLFNRKDEIKVVDDQIIRPTYSIHFAATLLKVAADCLRLGKFGIFHATGNGPAISWKGFADSILARHHETVRNSTRIIGISTEQYNARAKRPPFSVLDMSRLEAEFDISMPDWELALTDRIVFQKLF